jgi:BlaI family transcriptional regulator, penicillinase repressor
MKSKQQNHFEEPTKAELEILQVLWDEGPSTVRFVNNYLNEHIRPVQYSSTLKIMQLMADKRFLFRDERYMQHVYAAAVKEGSIKEQVLQRFIQRIYKGSATSLLVQLLGRQKSTIEELEEIKKLISQLEKK